MKMLIAIIGAFLMAGQIYSGTWFGRTSYRRPDSSYAAWGAI